jgi:chemotaxis protein methyltransferase CheR
MDHDFTLSGRYVRGYQFTEEDFQKICELVYEHVGISLKPTKRDMVYSRLVRRVRLTGAASFADYLAKLKFGSVEWQAFINALTTNLTAFFREPHHFPILADQVLKQTGRGDFAVWCAAASTGEEAYSIAMTIADALGSFTPPVTIIASDVDTNVLAKAEAGVYSSDRIVQMEPDRVKRFFLQGTGKQAGFVKVRPELRAMIQFRQVNLLDEGWPVRSPLDAIFCRNVMIYFDKPTQLKILQRFAPLMHPEGLLYAGHSENFYHAAHLWRPCGKTIYALKKVQVRFKQNRR